MLQRSNALRCLTRASYGRSSKPFLTHLHNPWFRRSYSPGPSDGQPYEIAVLGGGITGLSTAYWLTKKAPKANITVYEASKRVGGWVQSLEMDVDGDTVVFETGPRTLRTGSVNAMVTQAMLEDLDLADDIIFTSKDAASSRNRYIYYPDHLVRIPFPVDGLLDTLSTVLLEPAFEGILWQVLKEPWKWTRPSHLLDESVGEFLTRRIGKTATNNLVSAVFHGIYAGDIWQLSAKSIMRSAWELEGSFGSFGRGLSECLEHGALVDARDAELKSVLEPFLDGSQFMDDFKSSSVFAFKGGLSRLTEALETYLEDCPNVTLMTNCHVDDLTCEGALDLHNSGVLTDGKVRFNVTDMTDERRLRAPQVVDKDLVISTLPSRVLASMFAWKTESGISPYRGRPIPSIEMGDWATVMVVNFYFRESNIVPVKGFGYLIPQSVPFENNPERALGVIFDSDAVTGQDTGSGTKLTVMMGGHYWAGWDKYPSPEHATQMAMDLLKRHIGDIPEPAKTMATLQENCIPQYRVGWDTATKSAHEQLLHYFGGRLRVAGPSWHGVGLHDCTRAAYDVTEGADGWHRGKSEPRTGLEMFKEDPVFLHSKTMQQPKKTRFY
ncbi:Protoporphyrinogen oxidase [Pseudovirgaria hyperparasitica]|uniref:Protoporphyrinogen oxidase n=1 Tax=Pseudovirgaria hyperparasitica TaxID=470096 RepID=A0A6A6VV85_9PEZI|nr:Protoporphyrinogen oxidase [Pseudovirgaria hyperparasitica]KAF2753634.1 Protoporphyrinogen oxidase [Pseudovirgaria hyperparasitica]